LGACKYPPSFIVHRDIRTYGMATRICSTRATDTAKCARHEQPRGDKPMSISAYQHRPSNHPQMLSAINVTRNSSAELWKICPPV